jgi:NADH:ubiquinone oxidoreductase subunit E
MKKKIIIGHLRTAYKKENKLSKEQKDALLEAIKLIQKEKGEFNPAWIAIILQALGIGIEIFYKGP